MSSLRERVETLLALRSLSQAEATRRSGFNNTSFINDILKGKKISVRGPALAKLVEGLSTNPQYLLLQSDDPEPTVATEAKNGVRDAGVRSGYTENPDAPEIDKGLFPRDVPLIGIAACGDGDEASFTLNGETGDYVRRPPGLEGKRSVYAINVYGESMWPAYRHGQLVYVDPKREPGPLEDAIIEMHPEDRHEPSKGFLKRVLKVTAQRVICEQYNPHLELTYERADIKSFHRVMPWEEVLGY